MSCVIVRLKGGLGNQLFQYAAARAIALNNGVPLKLDAISGFRGDYYKRSYALNHFNISATLATPYECYASLGGRPRRMLSRQFAKLRSIDNRYYVEEILQKFDPRIPRLSCAHGLYLEGYWQSELYFKNVEKQIRIDLQIIGDRQEASLKLANRICSSNSIAIHYRRLRALPAGASTPPDLQAPDPNIVEDNFYEQSIQIIANRVKNPLFVIFSDSPAWAKRNVKIEYPFIVVDNNIGDRNSHEDLWLMSLCKHHILANSTFSWWGAWLRTATEGIVIAPEKIRFNADIVPAGWIVL